MYPSLMDQIAPGEFQANTADITTEDNLTYTIKIGDDVDWSDGGTRSLLTILLIILV